MERLKTIYKGDNMKYKLIISISEGKKVKIKKLHIYGIGGIRDIELNFSDGMNVICGTNGIGKTTILDVIGDAFINGRPVISKNAEVDVGSYEISIQDSSHKQYQFSVKTDKFEPYDREYETRNTMYASDIMLFKINREITYKKLDYIKGDKEKDIYSSGQSLPLGIDNDEIKSWFINRYVFYDKKGALLNEQIENFKLASVVFGILDDGVSFKTVKAGSLDIMLNTTKGEIFFEYLSSGYKSCVYIILGIIKEIELRFTKHRIYANEFDGVILIDEIDLHLHPILQSKLIKALKEIFPRVQFIVTTHSPSVLQTLDRNEIISLGQNSDGDTIVNELNLGEYGLQGWTLEEILQDVMGMPSTTSELYKNTIENFDKAMDDDNIVEIKRNYEILNKMLHPKNTLRKLLQIQMAGLEE